MYEKTGEKRELEKEERERLKAKKDCITKRKE